MQLRVFLALFYPIIVYATCEGIQDFYWRDYIPGYIPQDAIPAADGIYIGQVNYQGNIPATIYAHNNIAVAEMAGKQPVKDNIKILCSLQSNRFYWKNVNFNVAPDNQMQNAVKGGYQNDFNLYVGKVYHEGEWKIGKVVEIFNILKGLYVWDHEGHSVRIMEFYLLKYNSTVGSQNEVYIITRSS